MMNPATICFFNSAMTWGGGEKWHCEAALFMQQSGHRVLVVTSPGSALQQQLPGTIECIGFKVKNLSYLNPIKIIRLKNLLRQKNVQCIIINLSADLKLAGLAAKLARVKRIIYRRGSAIPIKDHFLNRFYFGKILTDVLANSKATKETVLQNNGGLFPANKIKVIYNPIHTEELAKRKYTPVYIKGRDELVLGNIGRLVPQKNQRFLVDVAALLKSSRVAFKLLIAGSGPLEKELKEYAKEKSVSQEIMFTGFLENVKDLLMSCDIFVLPSLWEGFGYVLAEASLCKKPVVAFSVSSNPELVINGETGFLTETNNLQEFYDKLMILKSDPEMLARFGENGVRYILDNFSDEKIKAQLSAYLNEQL